MLHGNGCCQPLTGIESLTCVLLCNPLVTTLLAQPACLSLSCRLMYCLLLPCLGTRKVCCGGRLCMVVHVSDHTLVWLDAHTSSHHHRRAALLTRTAQTQGVAVLYGLILPCSPQKAAYPACGYAAYILLAARWCAPAIQQTGLAKKGLKVVLRGGDAANAELFHQHLGHIGRKKGGQCGAHVDVLDT